jgi:drug/metabolite transporter (DMT)-like permease
MEANAPLSRTKAALPPVVFVYLGVIIITWAGNWPLMKLALGEVPPLVFVLLRLIGSLALIAPALLLARCHDRPRLFSLGQGLDDHAGRDGRTSTDADSDR